ncbi:unnamed protein product [Gadus morhua 'NCC']
MSTLESLENTFGSGRAGRVVTVVPASVLHGSADDRGPENSVGPSGSAPTRGRARRPLQGPFVGLWSGGNRPDRQLPPLKPGPWHLLCVSGPADTCPYCVGPHVAPPLRSGSLRRWWEGQLTVRRPQLLGPGLTCGPVQGPPGATASATWSGQVVGIALPAPGMKRYKVSAAEEPLQWPSVPPAYVLDSRSTSESRWARGELSWQVVIPECGAAARSLSQRRG